MDWPQWMGIALMLLGDGDLKWAEAQQPRLHLFGGAAKRVEQRIACPRLPGGEVQVLGEPLAWKYALRGQVPPLNTNDSANEGARGDAG